jgi:hypothetical protein
MKTQMAPHVLLSGTLLLSLLLMEACHSDNGPGDYAGEPFGDSVYEKRAQVVPGKLQCEYYDFGGEGVAYHDSDSVNSGSGGLNKADGSYLHEFRINEAVDISYTKFQDPPIDNSPYNFVEPEREQLYVGWTAPGEWIKYTIDVESEGTYRLGIMFTSNQGGKISFSVNDLDLTGPLTIPSTFVAADTVDFRQWHHWNHIDEIATVKLGKGVQTFTIHTVETGQMNYDFIHFELVR